MNDDEKMFQIGAWALGVVLLMSVVLQVCFRTQGRQINRIGREREAIQAETAVADVQFETLTNAEFLGSVVTIINPHAEDVSFSKFISVEDLPDREGAQ